MRESDSHADPRRAAPRRVFISYATADRKQASAVCAAIEQRGTPCWIAARDVAPGENYQEAIVHAIRNAPALVLVFSGAANTSNEIKKELSLASRHDVPVLALRLEDVEPSDAFAYELATRQWIDAFEGWDASIDALLRRIAQLPEAAAVAAPSARPATVQGDANSKRPRRAAYLAAAVVVLVGAVFAAWWVKRPTAPSHTMTVRLAGFRLLSPDLPASTAAAVDAEIAAAFSADGVIGVSNAPTAAPGSSPAYALGGTIQRDGDTLRVITRLTNERSGTTLWSDTFDYAGDEAARIPRHIAVDAGNIVRCGLFGASTYPRALPDNVLRDYLQFCQGHWNPVMAEGGKALLPAQRVVAAVPDFSWGWAAVAGGFWKVAMRADSERAAAEARADGRAAADRAIAIDARNSEALYIKALLLDRHDWVGREALLKRALAARRLDCGCEHHQYGFMLANVGRISDAVEELHRANDMLALYVYTPITLADALVAAGKPSEAKRYYEAAASLAPDAGFAAYIAASAAGMTGDPAPLLDPATPMPDARRSALLDASRALQSGKADAKSAAARQLAALPMEQQNDAVAIALARLGDTHAAFDITRRLASREYPGPSIFWYPSLRGVLDEPGFPAEAERLGLMRYWKTQGVRPDVCKDSAAPAFCAML